MIASNELSAPREEGDLRAQCRHPRGRLLVSVTGGFGLKLGMPARGGECESEQGTHSHKQIVESYEATMLEDFTFCCVPHSNFGCLRGNESLLKHG